LRSPITETQPFSSFSVGSYADTDLLTKRQLFRFKFVRAEAPFSQKFNSTGGEYFACFSHFEMLECNFNKPTKFCAFLSCFKISFLFYFILWIHIFSFLIYILFRFLYRCWYNKYQAKTTSLTGVFPGITEDETGKENFTSFKKNEKLIFPFHIFHFFTSTQTINMKKPIGSLRKFLVIEKKGKRNVFKAGLFLNLWKELPEPLSS
jgi:hypothetical protein